MDIIDQDGLLLSNELSMTFANSVRSFVESFFASPWDDTPENAWKAFFDVHVPQTLWIMMHSRPFHLDEFGYHSGKKDYSPYWIQFKALKAQYGSANYALNYLDSIGSHFILKSTIAKALNDLIESSLGIKGQCSKGVTLWDGDRIVYRLNPSFPVYQPMKDLMRRCTILEKTYIDMDRPQLKSIITALAPPKKDMKRYTLADVHRHNKLEG